MIETESASAGRRIGAIVLGHGPTALGTLRCLARAGIEPYLVAPRGDVATLSRFARGRQAHSDGPTSAAELDDLARGFGLEQAVLLPCTDEWTKLVAHLPLDGRLLASMPPADVIETFVDKLRFAETLNRLGIPKPVTIGLSGESDLDRPLDGMFLKPRQSQLFGQAFHCKALWFDDRDDAGRCLARMNGVGVDGILQEYVPGPPTSHYFIDGFRRKDGRVTALFARRRIRMYPPAFGNSTLMRTVPVDEVRQAADDLVRLLDDVSYRGIFSAEFKRDDRDGVFKLLEVNSRPWWFIEFASVCGVNVCAMAVDDALGRDVPVVDHYAVGKRCLYLRQDVRAYRSLPRADRPSPLQLVGSWLGASPTIFSPADPVPALGLTAAVIRRARRGADA